MSRGLFITGTDTGIGKTVITAGIVRWLRKQKIDAVPMKPVQTGGLPDGNSLISTDLEFCLSASDIQLDQPKRQLMSPYIYKPACSPHLAGRLASKYPELTFINKCADELLVKHQIVVIEGAGGILVPVNESSTMLDLMKMLGFPVILVARFGLGTINHTLLSIQVLQASGIKIIGVIFNRIEPSNPENIFIEEDNPKTISRFGNINVLGQIDYLANPDPVKENTWDHFERGMTGFQEILNELDV